MTSSPIRVLILTATLTAVFVLSVWSAGGPDPDQLPRDWLLLALNTLPLLGLRRNPLAVLLLFSVTYPLWIIAGNAGHLLQSMPTLAALYAVGSWDRPLWLRAIGLAAPAWMLGASASGWWEAPVLEIAFVTVIFVVIWALGVVVAARHAYTAQLEAKTVALAEAQRELADRAVADERARIARELHDVIAHAMSVITVRAGVGAHLITSRPAEAAAALEVIEHTGREALAEMRRMLAVLRDPDPHGPRPEPQPGLGDVPRLISQVSAAGLVATQTVEGVARRLPAGLDLAAYRVIQEALTNVVKHAAGARASVTIRYQPEWIEVEVRNAGHRPSEPLTPGLGLRGMAERVALYGGQLDIGADGHEFRVKARFPEQVAA